MGFYTPEDPNNPSDLLVFVPDTSRRRRLPEKCLPQSGPSEDEVNIIAARTRNTPMVVQRISFLALPAEIRNHIYELALPTIEDELIVATPFKDELMSIGSQPAITRVSKQLRDESLTMFYNSASFVAYVKDFDFTDLITWAKCISVTQTSKRITVHVKLLGRISCTYQLLDLMRGWRDIETTSIHLKIHNCYTKGTSPVYRVAHFDQRDFVASAVHIAEWLRKRGRFSEAELIWTCYERFEGIDRDRLGSMATGPAQSCVYEGVGHYHWERSCSDVYY